MKKLSVILALVLCLVLVVFSFASCGKKSDAAATGDAATNAATAAATDAKTDAATQAATDAATQAATDAATEAATDAATQAATDAATDAATEPATDVETEHQHVYEEGEENYVVDVEPTCTAAGSKSYHCSICHESVPGTEVPIDMLPHTPDDEFTVQAATCVEAGMRFKFCTECGEIIEDTIEELEIDPDAHNVAEWDEDDISLLNPTGEKTGVCTLCGAPVVVPIEYKPNVWNANAKNSGNKVDKRTYQSIRGEDHFYPTDDNLAGNDLLIEFSILYNDTLETLAGSTFDITVGDGSDFVNLKLAADANARYGTVVGGFSARDRNDGKGAILSTPTAEAIAADPAAKYPSIGEYGWHRVAVRVHQEADIVDDAVVYTYTGEAYLDGELILAFDLSKWASGDVLLFTAEIVDGALVYSDNDGATSWAEIAIYDFYKGSDVYVAIADTYMTCGQDFVQQVEAVADPEAATFTFDDLGTPDDATDDVIRPAAIYFKAKD